MQARTMNFLTSVIHTCAYLNLLYVVTKKYFRRRHKNFPPTQFLKYKKSSYG